MNMSRNLNLRYVVAFILHRGVHVKVGHTPTHSCSCGNTVVAGAKEDDENNVGLGHITVSNIA